MSARRLLVPALLLALLAGCGHPDLWARWNIERAFWHANRRAVELERMGDRAGAAELDRAIAAFDDIVRRYPPGEWGDPVRLRTSPYAYEVADLSGRAMISTCWMLERRGRGAEAMARYLAAREAFAPLPALAAYAAAERAEALERLGLGAEAVAAWDSLGHRFAIVDTLLELVVTPVFEAPLRVAGAHAAAGRAREADSVLADADGRLSAALRGWLPEVPPKLVPGLWLGIADTRWQRRDGAGARDAARRALAASSTGGDPATILLEMAGKSLAIGEPDSARAYARWAEAFGGEVRKEAIKLTGRAWAASGVHDSVFTTYARLLEAYPQAHDAVSEARLMRGQAQERLGRWELGRSEYRALASELPTHPYAFEVQLRIVRHHVIAREPGMARAEGLRSLRLMDHIIDTQHDDRVQHDARTTRAEILLEIGDVPGAVETLEGLWRRERATGAGAWVGLRAAALAESALSDRARARVLYEQVARESVDPAARARAEAGRARLAGGGG
jgi:tetratricopeptide (TPR) repeat protein